MNFEWDENKNKLNQQKHRISFEEASTALLDPLSMTDHDPDHSINEERFITFEISSKQRLLVISHTERNNNTLRIISTRKANLNEREIYEND
jgi:uncharacterized DUF497 family protein